MSVKKKNISNNWQVNYFLASERQTFQNSKTLDEIDLPEFWFDLPPLEKIIYQKSVNISENKPFTYLHCDRLESPAEFIINGERIHKHNGEEANFFLNISDYIKINQENGLQIKIQPSGLDGRIKGKVFLIFSDHKLSSQKLYSQEKAIEKPVWLKDTIIYELYVRAFSEKGNLKSVIKKLDDLADLGVNCLWLMPIFPIGEQDRKGRLGSPYSIKDFKKINSRYGSSRDLKKLVSQAHKRDMKIILDMVCNHAAWDNSLLEKHPAWFTKNNEGNIIQPPGTDWFDVADIDYSNREVRDYMLDILIYWVKKYDIDGYRMDVAEYVPLDFWKHALKEIKKIKPEILFLAEGDHPKLHARAFHLSYGWNSRLSLLRILSYKQSARAFKKVMQHEEKIYPAGAIKMRFSENHDLGRSCSIFGKEESRVAAVLNFTVPGIPMIYAGQEIGARRRPSVFDKDIIEWESADPEFYNFYQRLIKLRKENKALQAGRMEWIKNNYPAQIISFARVYNDQKIIILTNVTDRKIKVTLKLQELFKNKDGIKFVLNDTEKYVFEKGRFEIGIEPFSYFIFI